MYTFCNHITLTRARPRSCKSNPLDSSYRLLSCTQTERGLLLCGCGCRSGWLARPSNLQRSQILRSQIGTIKSIQKIDMIVGGAARPHASRPTAARRDPDSGDQPHTGHHARAISAGQGGRPPQRARPQRWAGAHTAATAEFSDLAADRKNSYSWCGNNCHDYFD